MCFCFPRFLVKTELNYNLGFAMNIVILGTLKEKYQNDSIKGKTKHGTVFGLFSTL